MKEFDFLIVGSGFAGSIFSMALANCGFSVCLIEKETHPRFAIGESSTPIADMILRNLADQYDLPFLKKISRYGEWQKNYPNVICGLKRGFSYYAHQKGARFSSDDAHTNELLVAASENDENSDTNWLRSDVDYFLVKKAVDLGVDYRDNTMVRQLERDQEEGRWKILLETPDGKETVQSQWMIDATGSPKFSGNFMGTEYTSEGFETNSSTIYTHFKGVDCWLKSLDEKGFKTSDYPYDPDFSALHHIIDEGWIWMLRFKNDLLSAGILLDGNDNHNSFEGEPAEIWEKIITQYPSIQNLFQNAKIADDPGHFIQTGRLQGRLNKVFGDGWVCLPHSAGFVDPLHSSGIALTLSGIEVLLKTFSNGSKETGMGKHLKKYQDKLFNELEIIDLIISSGYLTRRNFRLFTAASMLYFIPTIRYEQKRLKGEQPDAFLCVDEPKIQEIIQKTYAEIREMNVNSLSEDDVSSFEKKLRKRIEPLNTVGLMNAEHNNMYEHTAAVL